jgi:hypothetical protein
MATEALLDVAIDIYQSAEIENYVIPISPSAQPAQLTKWLVLIPENWTTS